MASRMKNGWTDTQWMDGWTDGLESIKIKPKLLRAEQAQDESLDILNYTTSALHTTWAQGLAHCRWQLPRAESILKKMTGH